MQVRLSHLSLVPQNIQCSFSNYHARRCRTGKGQGITGPWSGSRVFVLRVSLTRNRYVQPLSQKEKGFLTASSTSML